MKVGSSKGRAFTDRSKNEFREINRSCTIDRTVVGVCQKISKGDENANNGAKGREKVREKGERLISSNEMILVPKKGGKRLYTLKRERRKKK